MDAANQRSSHDGTDTGETRDAGGTGGDVAGVVIVGAGPVGLMLAGELGRAGVRSVVLERERERSDMPRANGLVGHAATLIARRRLLRGVPRAHVFSAGGSALNVGILDAVDLAPRLAAVLTGRAGPEFLERYHEERHRAGERAVLQTRAQSALSAPGPDADALREVLSAAIRARNPRRYLATLLIGDS